VSSDRGDDRWIEPGVPFKAPVDVVGNAVMTPDFVEQLEHYARAEPVHLSREVLSSETARGLPQIWV
jgi:hypothetical protein